MDYPKSVPGVGLVAGRFVDEDPIAGRAGSLIPAAWGNAVTESILRVQEAAGMEAEEGDATQLREAIIWLLRNLSATELVAGSARIASTSQAQARTDDHVIVTPKKLDDAFKGINQSLAGVGFQKLPGGLILQWGLNSSVAGTWSKFVYPMVFPNSMLIRGAFSNDTGGMGIFSTVSNQPGDDIKASVNVSVWTASNTRASAGLTSWVFALGN